VGGPTRPAMPPCGDGDGIDDDDVGFTKLYPYVTADMSSIVSSGDEVRSISFLAPDLLSMSSRSVLIFLSTCCVTFSRTWKWHSRTHETHKSIDKETANTIRQRQTLIARIEPHLCFFPIIALI